MTRFDALAQDYALGRPGYPSALGPLLSGLVSGRELLVDLACGTGLSTRPFLPHFERCLGIEPSAPMRAWHPGEVLEGRAEATGLQPESVDAFVTGQGMHWFALPELVEELRRVGRGSAVLLAFWNRRPEGEGWEAYERVLLEGCPEYRGVKARWSSCVEEMDQLLPRLGAWSLDNPQVYSRERLLALARSSSYVDRSPHRERVLAQVAELPAPRGVFTTHAFAYSVPLRS